MKGRSEKRKGTGENGKGTQEDKHSKEGDLKRSNVGCKGVLKLVA